MGRIAWVIGAAAILAACDGPDRGGVASSRSGVSAPRVTEVAELRDPIQGARGGFGRALAMSAGTLAASEPSGFGWGGHVHVYGLSGSRWVHEAILMPPAAEPWSGRKLAAGPGRVVIGSGTLTGGYVQVFDRTRAGWRLSQELRGPPDATAFGTAVALAGDRMLVTGRRGETGAVWSYQRGSAGWALVQELSNPYPRSIDDWGLAVALTTRRAVIADPSSPSTVEGVVGKVFVYDDAGGAWQLASELEETHLPLTPYAYWVAASDDLVAFSALDGWPVHVWSGSGAALGEEVELFEDEPSGSFGHAVAIGKNFIVIAAECEVVSGIEQRGALSLYARTASGWAGPYRFDSGEEAGEYEFLGHAVAAYDDLVAAAAPGAEEVGDEDDYGEVYVFQVARVR